MNIESLKEEGSRLRMGIDIHYFAKHYADRCAYDNLVSKIVGVFENKTDFNQRICFLYTCLDETTNILFSLYGYFVVIYTKQKDTEIESIVADLESEEYTVVVREFCQFEVDKNDAIVQRLFPVVL